MGQSCSAEAHQQSQGREGVDGDATPRSSSRRQSRRSSAYKPNDTPGPAGAPRGGTVTRRRSGCRDTMEEGDEADQQQFTDLGSSSFPGRTAACGYGRRESFANGGGGGSTTLTPAASTCDLTNSSSLGGQTQQLQQPRSLERGGDGETIMKISHSSGALKMDSRRSSVVWPPTTATQRRATKQHGPSSTTPQTLLDEEDPSSPIFNNATAATSIVEGGADDILTVTQGEHTTTGGGGTNATAGCPTIRSGIPSQDEIACWSPNGRDTRGVNAVEEGTTGISFPLISTSTAPATPPAPQGSPTGTQPQEAAAAVTQEEEGRESKPKPARPVYRVTIANLALWNERSTKARLLQVTKAGQGNNQEEQEEEFNRPVSALIGDEGVHTIVGTHFHLRAWLDHQLAVRARRSTVPGKKAPSSRAGKVRDGELLA